MRHARDHDMASSLAPRHSRLWIQVAPPSAAGAHRRAALHEGFRFVCLLALVGIVALCALLLLFYAVAVTLPPDRVGSCVELDDCPVPPQADEAVWVEESLPGEEATMTRW
jgi:hypothetical protein